MSTFKVNCEFCNKAIGHRQIIRHLRVAHGVELPDTQEAMRKHYLKYLHKLKGEPDMKCPYCDKLRKMKSYSSMYDTCASKECKTKFSLRGVDTQKKDLIGIHNPENIPKHIQTRLERNPNSYKETYLSGLGRYMVDGRYHNWYRTVWKDSEGQKEALRKMHQTLREKGYPCAAKALQSLLENRRIANLGLEKSLYDTPAERALGNFLSSIGVKFITRKPFYSSWYGNSIPSGIRYYRSDFYLEEKKIIIEVDGSVHYGREEYDKQRDKWFQNELGIKTIRLSNEDCSDYNKLNSILSFLK